jgi:hypothetical protein
MKLTKGYTMNLSKSLALIVIQHTIAYVKEQKELYMEIVTLKSQKRIHLETLVQDPTSASRVCFHSSFKIPTRANVVDVKPKPVLSKSYIYHENKIIED